MKGRNEKTLEAFASYGHAYYKVGCFFSQPVSDSSAVDMLCLFCFGRTFGYMPGTDQGKL